MRGHSANVDSDWSFDPEQKERRRLFQLLGAKSFLSL